jgi:Fe2+ transport system protein B
LRRGVHIILFSNKKKTTPQATMAPQLEHQQLQHQPLQQELNESFASLDLNESFNNGDEAQQEQPCNQASLTKFRWKHKKHWKTVVGDRRYRLATQFMSPALKESKKRRNSVKDSLDNLLLSAVDNPML